MRCPEDVELLAALELPAPDPRRTALEEHAGGCSRCQEAVRDHRRLTGSLASVFTGDTLPRPGCPEPQAWLDLAHGRAGGADAESLRRHLAACGACAAAAAGIVLGLDAELPNPGPPPAAPAAWSGDELLGDAVAAARGLATDAPFAQASVAPPRPGLPRLAAAPSPPRSRRRVAALALAASLAGLALVARFGLPTHDREPPALRAGTPAPGAGLPVLLSPREGQRLAGSDLELGWQAVTGARRYTATVVDGRGTVVWEGAATGTSIRLPADLSLAPATSYFAWVTAEMGNGRSVTSPAVGFTVAGTAR